MNKESDILLALQEQPLEVPLESQQYNLPSYKKKALNGTNFITSKDNFVGDVWRSPGKIPEEERIEIRVNEVNRFSTSK
jgi:hypothetical protein